MAHLAGDYPPKPLTNYFALINIKDKKFGGLNWDRWEIGRQNHIYKLFCFND
jgi:hypothetical protein